MKSVVVPENMAQCFEEIDSYLGSIEHPLLQRPIVAAMYFVDYYVTSVDSKPVAKDSYISNPWFGELILFADKWYTDKYRDSVHPCNAAKLAHWVVLIGGSLYRIDIPLYASQAGKDELSHIVYFPCELLDFEDALGFLNSPPNFEKFDKHCEESVTEYIRLVTKKLRTITRYVLTCESRKSDIGFAVSILRNIEQCVTEVFENSSAQQYTTFFWEMQMALEKMYKLVLSQNSKANRPHTHDLSLLANKVSSILNVAFVDPYSVLPELIKAVNCRYGEGSAPTQNDIIKELDIFLDIMYNLSLVLKEKKGVIRCGSITLQLPWMRSNN